MNYTKIAISFLAFAIVIILMMDLKTKLLTQTMLMKLSYNRIFDHAVEDTFSQVLEQEIYEKERKVNPERTAELLCERLYDDFSIHMDAAQQNKMNKMIKAILITEMDGYYIGGCTDNGQIEFKKKKLFVQKLDNYLVYINFSDELKVADRLTGELYEGNFVSIKNQINKFPFENRDEFGEWKTNQIIIQIREALEEVEGGKYQFTFPYIKNENYYQSVEGVSLLVFFRGNPVGIDGISYERFVFSGTRLEKRDTSKEG